MAPVEIGRYLYWSDRQIHSISSDNGIKVMSPWSLQIKSPASVAGIPLPQVEVVPGKWLDVNRRKVASRLSAAIGDRAESVFDSLPPAQFAAGVGKVTFARFVGGPEKYKGMLAHIRTTERSSGRQIDLVLFGSMDNLSGYRRSDATEVGWTSSAWYAISELLESRGTRNSSQWDDPESLSVEGLKIALDQGKESDDRSMGQPWARGSTLGHAPECEWLAVIYTDIVLDPARWNFQGESCEGASRIMIGAPVWIRTASPRSVVRYGKLRQDAASSSRGWRRVLPRRRKRERPRGHTDVQPR